jgi:soluble lytic murein transglycosylase
MTARISVTLTLLLLLLAAMERSDGDRSDSLPDGAPQAVAERVVATPASDSALAELAVGRYWHAAEALRAEGFGDGAPADVLLLAKAEAGWENWGAVAELLRVAEWLEDEDGGSGLYLLGRALEAEEEWLEAADAHGAFIEIATGSVNDAERAAARSRRARALWMAGEHTEALSVLADLADSPSLRSWAAAELILGAMAEGDTAGVRALLPHVSDGRASAAVWRAEADARMAADDSTGASEAYRGLRATSDGTRRGDVTVELGRLTLAAGDTLGGRALLLEGLDAAGSAERTRAAEALADLGDFDFERTLGLARVLDRAGDGARALRSYDRAVELASVEGATFPEWARVERARIMSTVQGRQEEALEEFRAVRESTTDERIGARNLQVWRGLRRRQGMDAQVRTLRGWLVEEYPGSAESTELIWDEGFSAEGRGALDVALDRYGFIAENARTSARAGQSRMRSGHIHLRRGHQAGAAEVFEAYLSDFPDGRRWQEAAYWAGRIRLELGDTATARRHLTRTMREQPIEYYAVVAAELLGLPYEVDVPEGDPPAEPMWLTAGLSRLDALRAAGLERGASAEVSAMRRAAEGSRPAMLRLAEALIERGLTIDGINLGWALLEESGGWDEQLLRVTFPFPYRELVRREAAEWGVDPLMLAAIIRQESAFKSDIVSRAGAIGLMQVMPPTGAQLARAHGPRPFHEGTLARPEVNLHLGAAFFVEMSARYDNDLPLVLSAYNAGPTRANRWRNYPEAADPLRFTERIPFDETRGYVKSVRRNLGLYRALYGDD